MLIKKINKNKIKASLETDSYYSYNWRCIWYIDKEFSSLVLDYDISFYLILQTILQSFGS
jgi:hypothetical protein